MAGALRLVQRIVREPWREDRGRMLVAGCLAVEADFPCCGPCRQKAICGRMDRLGRMYDVRTGRERYHLVPLRREIGLCPGFQDPLAKTLFPALVFAFSISQRIFAMRSGAMKFA